jgi:hypothetical protein
MQNTTDDAGCRRIVHCTATSRRAPRLSGGQRGTPNPHDTDVFGAGIAGTSVRRTARTRTDQEGTTAMTTQTASKSANKNRFEIDVTKIRDDARKHMAEIIRWIGDADPTTRRLMEKILEQGEEHADDLNDLLGN